MTIAGVGIKFTIQTGIISKICPTLEYKCGKRWGRSDEVVKRHEKSILGKLGAILKLAKEEIGSKYPLRYIKISPLQCS